MPKNLYVTTVHVLGIFVPGLLLACGILTIPAVRDELFVSQVSEDSSIGAPSVDQTDAVTNRPKLLGSPFLFPNVRDSVGFYIALVVVAYVIGFILRLFSIRLLEVTTVLFWGRRLRRIVTLLEPSLKSLLRDDVLYGALAAASEAETRFGTERTSSHRYAPHFAFLSRLVRTAGSEFRSEREHLEAEIRLAAGLVAPLALWWYLAISTLHDAVMFVVLVVTSIGLITIIVRFPERRVHEVLYTYYLALIVLRKESSRLVSGKPVEEERYEEGG